MTIRDIFDNVLQHLSLDECKALDETYEEIAHDQYVTYSRTY